MRPSWMRNYQNRIDAEDAIGKTVTVVDEDYYDGMIAVGFEDETFFEFQGEQ